MSVTHFTSGFPEGLNAQSATTSVLISTAVLTRYGFNRKPKILANAHFGNDFDTQKSSIYRNKSYSFKEKLYKDRLTTL